MHLDDLLEGYVYQAWLRRKPNYVYSMAVFEPDADDQVMIDICMVEHEIPGDALVPSAERVLWGRLN